MNHDPYNVNNNWNAHRVPVEPRAPQSVSNGVFWGLIKFVGVIALLAVALLFYSVATMPKADKDCLQNIELCK